MSTKRRLSPLDQLFLWLETPSTTMHVAGMMIYEPPADASEHYLRDIEDELRRSTTVESPWNMKLATPWWLRNPLQQWVRDDRMDLDYHIRRSALPSPGSERELGTLVSRLHSNAIDFSRPPWEMHLIEGLEGGRFAIYFKVHHSLVDGFSATQFLTRSHTTDPAEHKAMFFQLPKPKRATPSEHSGGALPDLAALLETVTRRSKSVAALGKGLYNTQLRRDNEFAHLIGSAQAPKSLLNQRISRNRRFATQQYDLGVLKGIGKRHGVTLNDVVLTVIGGGLRAFLSELGELPDRPLIAFVPVNIRPKDDVGGGNAVGAILASLGTDVADPLERLQAVACSTSIAKAQLEGMTQEGMMAYSAALLAPLGVQAVSAYTGVPTPLPLNFNIIVSNVPGPSKPLYLRGAKLQADYPVSIPVHGVALNITLLSYVDTMCFGFVGCRETLPHLQRLAVQTGEAFDSLHKAALG